VSVLVAEFKHGAHSVDIRLEAIEVKREVKDLGKSYFRGGIRLEMKRCSYYETYE
jgi:hypothetical protein